MKVLLIGNYPVDRQESMLRFAALLESELADRGISVSVLRPDKMVNRFELMPASASKWLGYIDKFALFPFLLRSHASQFDIVHICDQSNSIYLNHIETAKTVITCHDLLAVRGALGEDTGCYSSPTGKILQRWILRSLPKADMIVCDSDKTRQDVERLAGISAPCGVKTIHIGLNFDYKVLEPEVCKQRLADLPVLLAEGPFILNLSSNEPRKNRAGALRIFTRINKQFPCLMVFAGDPITRELRDLADGLGVADRIIEVVKPDNQLIEALYNSAFAFLFPSIAEGFGWPVIEAQASGCPVVCSNREPLPEIAGAGALLKDIDDEDGFAQSILSLRDPDLRQSLVKRGIENSQRFKTDRMISDYIETYETLLGKSDK